MNRMNSLKTEIYIIAIGKHSSNEFPTECAVFPNILEPYEDNSQKIYLRRSITADGGVFKMFKIPFPKSGFSS